MRRPVANSKINFIFNVPFSVLLLFALFLIGCEKKETEGSSGESSFNGKITAKVENGKDYDSQISTVWALFDAEVNSDGELIGRMVTDCDYKNGGFTIELPNVPSSFLMNIETFFSSGLGISNELDYSDSDARILDVDFFGISSDGDYVDLFVYTDAASKPVICLFVFSDSNVTVKGKNVDVSIKRGWNRVYWTPSGNKVTSSSPKNMKWYLYNDL